MRVGVFTAGYNCEQWAAHCIQSVRSQEGVEWVHGVGVDVSSDGTYTECVRAAAGDKRINIVQTPKRGYGITTRRLAIDSMIERYGLANDDILFDLGMDDYALPGALKIVHHVHECGAWATYGNWQDPTGYVWPHVIWTREMFAARRRSQWFMTAPNTLRVGLYKAIPEEWWRIGGTGKEYETNFDAVIAIAAAELSGFDRVKGIPDPLICYNRNREGCASQVWDRAYRQQQYHEIRNKPELHPLEAL